MRQLLTTAFIIICGYVYAGAPLNTRILPGTVTSCEAIIFWDKPDDYKNIPDYTITVNGKSVGKTDRNNFKILGLKPSARYKVTVSANPAKGRSIAGGSVSFQTKVAPEIFDVTKYGAVGDGKTLNTKAIQQAIDECTKDGEVYIPAGEYITGGLFILKDNISINLAEGATLKASHNLAHFPMHKMCYEGWVVDVYSSVLNLGKLNSEERYSDIRIFGGGTIDNQGSVLAAIQTNVVSRMARSHGLPIINCDNVALDGITVCNPCTWNVHPLLTNGLTTNNVRLISAGYPGITNGDTWDPDSSSDCYLINSYLEGQDDNIAIKSVLFKDDKGRTITNPSENIYVSYCHFVCGGGLCIGVEMPAPVRNVWFTDCVIDNCDRGLQVHNRPQPGILENIHFRDIDIKRAGCWGINVNLWYWIPSYMPGVFKAEDIRKVRNITFENIRIRHADGNPIQVLGMPEQPITDIVFRNVQIDSSQYDVLLRDCKNITFENVNVGEKYWIKDNAQNVVVDKLTSKPKTMAYPYKLVDPNATYPTRALYSNLHKVSESGRFLLGAQDATSSGYGWNDNSGRCDMEITTGKIPAFYSWDFMDIIQPSGEKTYNADKIRNLTCQAFYNGGVNSYCWHFFNPATEGSFYDTTKVVSQILPGGEHHDKFIKALDQIGEFNKTLIGRNGEHIPIIFRPWHEFDGHWFWWGARHCTVDEFKQLYRFTVTYLRDTLGIRNFLYAFSPDCGYTSTEEYLERYPGDEYVDIIATDNYWDFRYEQKDLDIAHKKLKIISDYAKATGKVAALSETGQNGVEDSRWFTQRLLKSIKGYPDQVNLAYVATWRNSVQGFFTPYMGHPALEDFRKFVDDPHVIMGTVQDYLGKFYHMD